MVFFFNCLYHLKKLLCCYLDLFILTVNYLIQFIQLFMIDWWMCSLKSELLINVCPSLPLYFQFQIFPSLLSIQSFFLIPELLYIIKFQLRLNCLFHLMYCVYTMLAQYFNGTTHRVWICILKGIEVLVIIWLSFKICVSCDNFQLSNTDTNMCMYIHSIER